MTSLIQNKVGKQQNQTECDGIRGVMIHQCINELIYISMMQLHWQVNGILSLLCDLYRSKIGFQSKNQLYPY